ncbi:MAG: methyl-accepting chemotaxis protein [Burkholderiaceae bacterium]
MNVLNNISIRLRLWASFGLVLVLMAINIGFGVVSGDRTEHEVKNLVEVEMRKYELAASINAATRTNARNTLQLFVSPPDQRATIRARMATAKTEIDRDMAQLEKLVHHPKGRALYDDIKARRGAFVSAFTAAADKLESDGAEAGLVVLNQQVLPAIDALSRPIEELLAFQQQMAHARGQDAEQHLHSNVQWSMGLGTVALVLGVLAAMSLVASIMAPLQSAIQGARLMAQGDLTQPLPVNGRNELADMMEELDQMREKLAHVLFRIQERTVQVAAASHQISAANLDLSARTEEQASALEQTAATMHELTSTVQANSHTTSEARQMVEQANESAKAVGVRVASVVSTMQDIHQSSQRIRDIVSVIDSIAFQTNILALNAAVEAARAGEQGRGFAVVASEVRALAQRSASAAQEIKGIIEENVSKMDAGNVQAEQAGAAVMDVVRSIDNVTLTIAEVDNASKEQSTGIGQVGEAVGQLDTVTQQNAALVEETAAATKNLDDQVQGLKAQINRFRIAKSMLQS